jgi:hypothetical protein
MLESRETSREARIAMDSQGEVASLACVLVTLLLIPVEMMMETLGQVRRGIPWCRWGWKRLLGSLVSVTAGS